MFLIIIWNYITVSPLQSHPSFTTNAFNHRPFLIYVQRQILKTTGLLLVIVVESKAINNHIR